MGAGKRAAGGRAGKKRGAKCLWERLPAHSPLDQSIPFLCIGPEKGEEQEEFVVSESPTGTDEGVYEEAYENEAERIKGEGDQLYGGGHGGCGGDGGEVSG